MTELAFRTEADEPVSTTPLLEASRRVDWRFLLPNPNLGRVVVAGSPGALLRESLALFSQSVAYVEPPFTQPLEADLVLLSGSLKTHLPPLLAAVKPSGYLYAEFSARRSLGSLRKQHPLVFATRLLRAHGFEEVQSHWHAPNFDGCKRIIPLDSPDALAFALRKSGGGAAQRLTGAGVSLAHRTGLLLRVASSFSIVARRGAP